MICRLPFQESYLLCKLSLYFSPVGKEYKSQDLKHFENHIIVINLLKASSATILACIRICCEMLPIMFIDKELSLYNYQPNINLLSKFSQILIIDGADFRI